MCLDLLVLSVWLCWVLISSKLSTAALWILWIESSSSMIFGGYFVLPLIGVLWKTFTVECLMRPFNKLVFSVIQAVD